MKKLDLLIVLCGIVLSGTAHASDDWEIQLNVTPASGTASLTVNVQATIIETEIIETEIIGLWEYNGSSGPGNHTIAVNQSTVIERTSDGTLEIFFQILEIDNELNRLKIKVTNIPVGTPPYGVGETFFTSYELQSNNAEMILNFNTSEYVTPDSGEVDRDYFLYQKIQ